MLSRRCARASRLALASSRHASWLPGHDCRVLVRLVLLGSSCEGDASGFSLGVEMWRVWGVGFGSMALGLLPWFVDKVVFGRPEAGLVLGR